MQTIGVISDTHNLLRPEALATLAGVDQIVHAGDIGSAEILKRLREIAPLTVVRGNNDRGGWAAKIPESQMFEVDGRRILILHDLKELNVDPVADNIAVVIAGHSHKPSVIEKNGVLFLNPGSAGPRRFKLPISVAKLRVYAKTVRAQIYELGSG